MEQERTVAPALGIAQEQETYVRPDGTTYTREDIYVRLYVPFRDQMLRKLKGPKLSVYLCIALHCGKGMESWPSLQTIMKETGYSNRAVIDAIRDLSEMGMIDVLQVGDPKTHQASRYLVKGYLAMGASEPSSPALVNDVHEASEPSSHQEEPCKNKPCKKESATVVASEPTLSLSGETKEEPKTKTPKGKKEKIPTPQAVVMFRQMANRYPAKSWYGAIDQAIGTEPDNLKRWGRIVYQWVGLGWNPTNVTGMLECFNENRMPGDNGNGNSHKSNGGTNGNGKGTNVGGTQADLLRQGNEKSQRVRELIEERSRSRRSGNGCAVPVLQQAEST